MPRLGWQPSEETRAKYRAAWVRRRSRAPSIWDRIEVGDCWIWKGSSRGYYGQYQYKGRSYLAHRYVYELLVAPIPAGMTLDHLCRNRPCVNPDHLEVVSSRINILRGASPHAINARKTHCKRGHEFTPENTTFLKGGGRRCRICARAKWSRWWRRHHQVTA